MTMSRKTRVLRLAVIVGRAITTERLISPHEPVTVGTDPHNTFVLPEGTVTGTSFLLFHPDESGYNLRFTRDFGPQSKVSTGGLTAKLSQLAGDHSVSEAHGELSLPLVPTDRGKLDLGGATLLFQFVEPPPTLPLATLQPISYRAPLLEDDDPIFLSFLSLWSGLALVLAVWVWSSELPVYTLKSLPTRVTELHVQPRLIVPQKITPPIIKPQEIDGLKRVASPLQPSNVDHTSHSPRSDTPSPVESRPALAKLIGNLGGDSSEGLVDSVWTEEDRGLGDDLDAILQQRGGMTTDERDPRLRLAVHKSGGPLSIGDLTADGVGGGPTAIAAAPTLSFSLAKGEGEVEEEITDTGAVRKVIHRYQRQFKYCFERELKRDPSVHGRVELEFEIYDGRVGEVNVVENRTRSSALAACMVARAKSWRFPPQIDGAVVWPFVFRVK